MLTDPALFDQSEADGTVIVLVLHPADAQQDHARPAVRLCPSGALRLDKATS